MSLEKIRAYWERRRCPFGVAEHCITTGCNAWQEGEAEYEDETERVWKTGMSSKPGMFSDWEYEDKSYTEYWAGEYDPKAFSKTIRVYDWYKDVTRRRKTSSEHGGCSRL